MNTERILHVLKVGLFIALSGAVTALAAWLTNWHPTAPIAVVVVSLVNIFLVWAKKYLDDHLA